jgi:hypothetical protein
MFRNSFLYNAQPLLAAGGLYLPTRLVSVDVSTDTSLVDGGLSLHLPTGLVSVQDSHH